MSWKLKRVFDEFVSVRKKMSNKIGATFATSGHQTGGRETTMLSIMQAMLIYGMILVGDPFEASGHYGVASVGNPDEQARKDGWHLGRRVAEVLKQMKK